MSWSEEAWKQIEDKYQSILTMPFVSELASGALVREKFKFYMAQDSLYLEHFGRALALVAARAHHIGHTLNYLKYAETAIVVENTLHDSFFKDFGVTERGTMQPACHHYIHFIKSTASLEAVEIGMAALLPCFWIYQKVGAYISNHHVTDDNPYKKWIDTYGGEEFEKAVSEVITICDKVATETTGHIRARMTEAFITSSHLEYQFWNGAYNLKKWD